MPESVHENRVLIVGGAESPEANLAAAALHGLGVEVTRCDTVGFPHDCALTLRQGAIQMGGKPMRTPRTVYVRGLACHPLTPLFEEDLASRPRGLIAQCDEKRAFLESMLLMLKWRGAKLVNGIRANAQHSRKPWQLDALERAGLPVPRWVVTNNPRHVRELVAATGEVVYKPLAGGAPAQWLGEDDLTDERLESLRLAPVLFQAYVEGTPLRAYVTGNRVAASAEIHASGLDSRQDTRDIVPVQLSASERNTILAATKTCGMSFSAVDCVRSPHGLVLLECNPSPMFAAFEELCGADVSGALAQLLAGRSKS